MTGITIAFILILGVVFLGALILLQRLYFKRSQDLEERNKRLTALRKMDEIMMSSTTNLEEVAQKVTDAISFELGFEIGVLALIDDKRKVLRRIAMSRTTTGIKAIQALPIPYQRVEIPLNYESNLSIKAIREAKMQVTHDLYDVFVPIFDRALSAKIQQTVKVKTSLIYPLRARGKIIGTMIVSIGRLEKDMSTYEKESIENLIDFVGIALDNAILYQSLKETTFKLEQANERLKELDRLKDDFVSIASHELRTPMTAIRSYVWMALHRSDVPLTEKLRRYLYRTLISTERLINLVNDMLNISRIESGRIEVNPISVDLIGLTKEVLEEVGQKALERQIHLSIRKEGMPPVFADPDKVRQVLMNLIGNSLKFTPPDGMITVEFFTDGSVVETVVKDTGKGISKDDLGKLFKKFGRLDNSYVAMGTSGGTGLGLYICKSLINLMHGRIWATSEGLDKGASFIFSLPIASEAILKQAAKFQVKSIGEAKELEPVAL